MVFAPAIGIASFQVLGAMCFLVAGLSAIVVVKQYIVPNDGLDTMQMAILAAIFAAAGLGCFWAAKYIRRIARGG
jgi:ATP/ADP translocase